MTPRQFAPGDDILIRAAATDDTAARLNLRQRASVPFGREDVVGPRHIADDAELLEHLTDRIWSVEVGGAEPRDVARSLIPFIRSLEASALACSGQATPVVPGEIVRMHSRVPRIDFEAAALDWVRSLIANQPAAPVVATDPSPVQAGSAAPADLTARLASSTSVGTGDAS